MKPIPNNPLIPMGAMTGDPSREELRSMLRAYADVGIRQYLIYPRDGCDVEYMSERWMEIVSDILEAAEEYGMEILLYDEFNWPSGRCDGAVMRENPGYCAKRIVVKDGTYTIEDMPAYSDTLSAEVTDCFIRLTHEKYYERFSKYFGTVIKGIFSDEPTYSYNCNFANMFPYTPGMEDLYAAETGRDFFADIVHPDSTFMAGYFPVVGKLFRKNFLGRLADWCAAHNIALTGHMLAESDIVSAVRSNVNTIANLRCMQLPGMDEISTRTSIDTAEWLTFGTVQAASRERGGGLAEVFALGPTDLPLAREEQMIWLEAMFGVDHYVLAVSAYDARGNVKKNRWYNPMCYTQPHFPAYKRLGETAAEAASYAGKKIAPQVFVRVPFEECARAMGSANVCDGLRKALMGLLKELTRRQIQWQLLTNSDPAPAGGITVTFTADTDGASLARHLRDEISSPITVLDAEGKYPDDLFVRLYADGSAVVLDIRDSSEPRRLVWHEKGNAFPFTLAGRGHYVRGRAFPQASEPVAGLSPLFRLALDRPNTLRANLNVDKLSYTFRAEADLSDIRLLVRQYKRTSTVCLDGRTVIADFPADALVRGLTELYASTAPFTLTAGEHTISISEAAEGEGYLPSCLIAGSFAASVDGRTDILRPLPAEVPVGALDRSVLPQYAGGLTLSCELTVPAAADALRIDCAQQYAELTVNGVCLGGSFSGYEWKLPEGVAGTTAKIEIRQYTSIGPLFGRADDAVAATDDTGWAPLTRWFPGKYESCGIVSVTAVKQTAG